MWQSFEEHIEVVRASMQTVIPAAERAADAIGQALADGGKVLAAGNGGSAAQAMHFAAELTGRYERDRIALAAVALSADQATLTAVSNDYGYEHVFARQVDGLARPGDVVLLISVSGTSPSIVNAARAALDRGCTVIALTGRSGGELEALASVAIKVPSEHVARVQEVHTLVLHELAGSAESTITA